VAEARPDRAAPDLLTRYRAFLPYAAVDPSLSLGEGATPLVRSASLGPLLRLEHLEFKLETANPTGSWLDRGSVAAIQRARELGRRRVAAIGAGTLARSLAAYAARGGLRYTVLCSGPCAPDAFEALRAYGARVVEVSAPQAALDRAARGLERRTGLSFVHPEDPFLAEGQKTLGLELAELSPGGPPDVVVLAAETEHERLALAKGFGEWRAAGLALVAPAILRVRTGPCAEDERWTIAAETREAEAARRLLAEEEGLLVGSGAALAGLVRAVRSGRVARDARIAVILTDRRPGPTAAPDRAGRGPIRSTLRGLPRILSDPAP
jgi:threonine synthase